MRRYNNCKTASGQDIIPTLLFFIVRITLIHHCILFLIQFETITLPEVNAWNVNQIISPLRNAATPFVTTTRSVVSMVPQRKSLLKACKHDDREKRELDDPLYLIGSNVQHTTVSIALGTVIFCSTLSTLVQPAIVNAYNDFISEPVQIAIKAVQDANTNEALVRAYENIAEIITEGKGVGGSINFQGVQLDRGYVSDEDTSIYNPGLTLLTESEKTRLVDTVVESKKRQLVKSGSTDGMNSWNNDLEAGYSFLRERLDPLHMYELRGYLSIVPIYGAVMYLVALAVQQLARDVFPIAYIVCAAAVFVPVIVLVLLGPQ
jgi:hypothetical protein